MKIHAEDVLTAPNAISAAGFALAVHGAMRVDTPRGVGEAIAGRLLDLADGAVARATGQGSEFGAAVDATLDKFAGLTILIREYQEGIAPTPALAAMFVQNTINGVATAAAMKKHPNEKLERTTEGALAMAIQNAALALYAGANLAKDKKMPRTQAAMYYLGHAATAIGVGYFGTKATKQYLGRARKKPAS